MPSSCRRSVSGNSCAPSAPVLVVNVENSAERVRGVSAIRYASTASNAAVSRCVVRRESDLPISASSCVRCVAEVAGLLALRQRDRAGDEGEDEQAGRGNEASSEPACVASLSFEPGISRRSTGVDEGVLVAAELLAVIR